MENFDANKHILLYPDPSTLTRVSFNNCIIEEKDIPWINNYIKEYYKENDFCIFEFKNVIFKKIFEVHNYDRHFYIELINCESFEQAPILFRGNYSLVQIRNSNLAQIGFGGNLKAVHIVESQINILNFTSNQEDDIINKITISHSDINEDCNINFNNARIDTFELTLSHHKNNQKTSTLTFGFHNFIDCRDFIVKTKENEKPNILIREFFLSDKEFSDLHRGQIDFRIKKIILSDININTFKLSGDITSIILTKNLQINKFILEDLISVKKLTCNNMSKYDIENEDSCLSYINSNLNNLIFSESDLDSFKKFRFEDNYINSITFDSCTMPSNEKIKQNDNSLSIARNLKNIFKKQEDKHLFLQYLSLENTLQLKKGKVNYIDSIILWSSKISNNFGINPLKAAIFTLLIAVITFTFSITNTSLFELNCHFSINDLKEASKYYWQFILPTHRFDYLEKGNEKIIYDSGFYFWDFLGRILVGFGIFQTIAAFRKYSS